MKQNKDRYITNVYMEREEIEKELINYNKTIIKRYLTHYYFKIKYIKDSMKIKREIEYFRAKQIEQSVIVMKYLII